MPAEPIPFEPAERRAILKAKRALKMARSAHAYVRGSTERFYEWLDESGGAHLPAGPPVWICGDCHVGNLGPIARTAGEIVVELRDLDQTVIGNPAFDLVRLALSLAMAARGSDLPGVTTARMTENLVAGYERAFEGEVPGEHLGDLPEPIRFVMKRAARRTWKQLSRDRLGARPRTTRLPLGRTFWPLTPAERQAVEEAVQGPGVRKLVTLLEARDDSSEVRLLDAAYWVKGCSSLGLWRAAALVEIIDPTKSKVERRSQSLLDFKEAIATWAPAEGRVKLPEHEGERVVAGARKLAPALGERMSAGNMLGHDVFIRELLPQDLKVELDELESEEGKRVALYLGMIVGCAHARQMNAEDRSRWLAELAGRRSKTLDAPSWLWSSVVELVGLHERAYLEHCRRYAMSTDSPAQKPPP